MQIHTLTALKDNFIYILATEAGDAVAVDPGEAAPVRKFLTHKNLRLRYILCTHHHADHIGGVEELVRESGAEVWASERDRLRIPGVTRSLKAEESTDVLGEPVQILSVPGHTEGQISYYFPKMDALFTGDTLFSVGCGRLFEGTAEQMFDSLSKIKRLPARTRIYFGHEYTLRNLAFLKHRLGTVSEDVFDYEQRCRENLKRGYPTSPTSLAQELKVNPFLKADTIGEFREWREARDHW